MPGVPAGEAQSKDGQSEAVVAQSSEAELAAAEDSSTSLKELRDSRKSRSCWE